jgi:hypothetical protein
MNKMSNLVSRWIIWSPQKQAFFKRRNGCMEWATYPNCASFYTNYSDAIMCCNQLLDTECHPVELRFHFNPMTLKDYRGEESRGVLPGITVNRESTIKWINSEDKDE